jgi:hypothetical protein
VVKVGSRQNIITKNNMFQKALFFNLLLLNMYSPVLFQVTQRIITYNTIYLKLSHRGFAVGNSEFGKKAIKSSREISHVGMEWISNVSETASTFFVD